MNKYLSKADFNFSNKTALVRIDCDVDLVEKNGQLEVGEDFRLRQVLPTLKFLDQAGVERIVMIGHLGRPGGQPDKKLSLAPIADWFSRNYKKCSLIPNYQLPITNYCVLLNNLRFYPGEIDNDQKFGQQLASLADVYINEAFATYHRNHASIVGLPKYLPSFLGLNFQQEIKNLTEIKNNPQRPLVIVLGGAKKGKLDYVPFLADLADALLIGGKLPLLIKDRSIINHQSLIIAKLSPNQRDISRQSIEDFKNQIKEAGSILMAGPLGAFEEKENSTGTFEIANFIADLSAFKLAAGGDTHQVLSLLNLWKKFDFVSTGGGAALQFLRDQTLPGIRAVNTAS